MTTREWFEANQRDMVAALERVRLALAYRAGAESVMPPIDGDEQRSTVFADGPALALGELQRVFGLSPLSGTSCSCAPVWRWTAVSRSS